MRKRIVTALIATILCAFGVFGLAACKDTKSSSTKNSIDGVYTVYMVEYDENHEIEGLLTFVEHAIPTEITIRNGKITQGDATLDYKLTSDGFYYINTFNNDMKCSFVKVADGEYYSEELSNYLCKNGQTPKYPIIGAF